MPAITHYAKKLGLIPAQSPDDKMNVMNGVNKENQTLQEGKSGSSPVLITTDAKVVNNSGGTAVYAMNNSTHSQKPLVTSKL